MSKAPERAVVEVFFALGDPTRLSLLTRLGAAGASTATTLADGARISRQAIVKHLQVLEGAGLVTHEKHGRQVLYTVDPGRLADARAFLDSISAAWDRALDRLRDLVETPPGRPPSRSRRP